MSEEPVILLLGRRDQPTDGVLDYCQMLREAGTQRGLPVELVSVPWAERGWRAARTQLSKAAVSWRGRWVLLQFTTLAWSDRGFPLGAPGLLKILRRGGARLGVVFHDVAPLLGSGIIGGAREYCQRRVFRQLYDLSELAIFTVPVNLVPWLPLRREKATFIPVGANCPEGVHSGRDDARVANTVAVYSITGGTRALIEAADLGFALRRASSSVGQVHVVLFGRGAREAEQFLLAELAGADVKVETFGLLRPEQVSQTLSAADVLLFVRGQISSRRGSAIAGIACGLPIVCYSGTETAWPITEAGILPVPLGNREALAAALETVLSDGTYRRELAERSRAAQKEYFSWASIADRIAEELRLRNKTQVINAVMEVSID
jgi:glycosyltransferase involved in cell wall biosynthesis